MYAEKLPPTDQTSLNPIDSKGLTLVQTKPDNPSKVRYTKRAFDLGNKHIKHARIRDGIQVARLYTAVAKVASREKCYRTFDYKGDTYAYGSDAIGRSNVYRLVTDLKSLSEARKIHDFDLFFRSYLAEITKVKKPDTVQRFRFVLSTSAARADYPKLKATIEGITSLVVNGNRYQYDLKVDRVVPEGWGVVRSGDTKSFKQSRIAFDRGLLLDLGEGTATLTEFDASRGGSSGETTEGEIISQNSYAEGCIEIFNAWTGEAASYMGNVAPSPLMLIQALERGIDDSGRYSFTSNRALNRNLNKALSAVLDSRWAAMMENPAIKNAIEKATLDKSKLYACGGGAILFHSQLKDWGFATVPEPGIASVKGMMNWLQRQA